MLELEISPERLSRVEGEIENFIAREVEEAGAEGVVMGLSGGIDSALSAKLAVEALGKERVLFLVMPEEGVTPGRDLRDALDLAASLGAESLRIEISPLVESFLSTFPLQDPAFENREAAKINLKPRVRMTLLYMAANARNLLVQGTGNRTELLLGYFTKYGDGGVDFLPLGGLYKTQVRGLAEHLGLPQRIIDRPPSPGLVKGQTDEEDLGMDYGTLDRILHLHLDQGISPGEIGKETGLGGEICRAILEKVEGSRHKRRMPRVKKFGQSSSECWRP